MNRKVVWNACYGGFNLSPRAKKMLYERKHPGETIYFYEDVTDLDDDIRSHTYHRVDEKDLDSCNAFLLYCVSHNFGREIKFMDRSIDSKRFNNHIVWNIEIERHDPDLVAVVEKLGSEKASGKCAKLEITDIGDSLYHIDEYDGFESVRTSLEKDFWK